ncbi:MAG: N-acetyltransferase [Myxococcota bacterium]|nr:N-acetyltransferase [Myxococcota bacterium]
MTSLELIRVPLDDAKLVERFIRVPWFIHREHHPSDNWVPPLIFERKEFLNPRKNPFFGHAGVALWLAHRDGQDIGRIAATHDRDWESFHDEKLGYFGMFDSPNDPAVAHALLDKATNWLREMRGLDKVIGPLDLSTNYVSGLLIDGFDSDPNMEMAYNPPYYAELLESYGLSKTKDLWQWYLASDTPIPEKVERIADKIRQRSRIQVREINLKDWDNEISRVLEVYNDAWEKNWGFVPVAEAEFRHIAEGLRLVVHPEMAYIAEVDGEAVAFSVAIMNLNPIIKTLDGKLFPFGVLKLLWKLKVRKEVEDCRLTILGIKSGYRRRGIDSILFVETQRACKRLGWKGGEIGWTLEDNHMVNRAIESMNGQKVKTYRVYGMDL